MKAATKIKCSAPSKVILSGEHSVIHGAPAISLTINQKSLLYLESTPTQGELSQNYCPKIKINLIDLDQQTTLSWKDFISHTQKLSNRLGDFKQGKITIDKVCLNPLDLPLATIYEFMQNQPLPKQNLSISYSSTSWQNRGLGSSASLVTSLVTSLNKLTKSQADLFKISQKAENYQHGKSSGLDTATILQGGWLKYHNKQLTPLESHNLNLEDYSIYLIDTGKAQSTTGETVAHTSKIFAQNPQLLEKFTTTTKNLEKAINSNNLKLFSASLTANQQLLEKLEIVPQKVQKFIQQANKIGVAKQCGAGSLIGEAGGVVLLFSKTNPQEICANFGYKFSLLTSNYQGVTCEMDS